MKKYFILILSIVACSNNPNILDLLLVYILCMDWLKGGVKNV